MSIKIKDKTRIHARVGETKINNHGSIMYISEYRNTSDIDVYFPEHNCNVYHKSYYNFKIGNINSPFDRILCGIGYHGIGKYERYNKFNEKCTKMYITWTSMIFRCYNIKHLEKYPTYIGCTVCEEWHNFQNFAEWYNENYYEIPNEMMHLDKDILSKGNKIYSPKTCVFVPQSINLLFVKANKNRGDMPIGVSYNKDSNKYQAEYRYKNNKIYLGKYNNKYDAFNVYKKYKESYIKEIAKEYKNKIPSNLYQAMINYIVDIND
jgi:hypothetical protein